MVITTAELLQATRDQCPRYLDLMNALIRRNAVPPAWYEKIGLHRERLVDTWANPYSLKTIRDKCAIMDCMVEAGRTVPWLLARLVRWCFDYLMDQTWNGSTCVSAESCERALRIEFTRALTTRTHDFAEAYRGAFAENFLCRHGDFVYASDTFAAETCVVDTLRSLRCTSSAPGLVPMDDGLSTEQQHAVRMAMSESVSVITGFAGTGKTRVIAEIVRQARGEVMLLAPTGAAVKRMIVSTGHRRGRCCTIHSATFMYRPSEDEPETCKMAPFDFVVVDEFSMVSLKLMAQILRDPSVDTGDDGAERGESKRQCRRRRFVFVGDPGQLPSIEAGRCLRDLLHSRKVPVARLTHVYRQVGQTNSVLDLATTIREQGQIRIAPGVVSEHITWDVIPRSTDVLQRVEELMADAYALNPRADVQVIMYRRNKQSSGKLHVISADFINDVVHRRVRPMPNVIVPDSLRPPRFHIGARVINRKNLKLRDYDLVNGDIGWITGVRVIDYNGDAEHVKVADLQADGTFVTGSREPVRSLRGLGGNLRWQYRVQWDTHEDWYIVRHDDTFCNDSSAYLDLAYATTVHSAQGNEYDKVIVVIDDFTVFMDTQWLYTAVTRAKPNVHLITTQRFALQEIVSKPTSTDTRVTRLANRME